MPESSQSKSSTDSQVNPFARLLSDRRFIDEETAQIMDLEFRAAVAKITQGMSPIEIINAYIDWLGHLAISPGKQSSLIQSLLQKASNFLEYASESANDPATTKPAKLKERRLDGNGWDNWPFSLMAQSYLLVKEWVSETSENVSGVSDEHGELVSFINEQIMEAFSPANFPVTNPGIVEATRQEQGENLKRGLKNLLEDRAANKIDTHQHFEVGKDVAITPGKVIYQNRLIELIQYKASTESVDAEPVLIIPPWIMKYYILDLSPRNSLVKYLVDQGKTVFMISWKNPLEEDRNLTMEDYLNLGVMESIKAVQSIVPKRRINAVGYCIGGTLLCIAAAAMGRDADDRFNSITLLTAQADFTEAGEIRRLISHSDLSFMESLMWKKGYLDSKAMGGAFAALRPGDLIWGPAVDRYLFGKEQANPITDLMSWNADGTRMPYRMHTDYLHQLYLNNELAEGKYMVDGRTVSLTDINTPLFVIGTVTDHVAPWKSVYKLNRLTNAELTFLLTSGGHNAGIICGPDHPRRSYQIKVRNPGDQYIDADTWQETVEVQKGSWWPVWLEWLNNQSSSQVKPPSMGAAKKGYRVVRDAPGEYVLG